MIDMAALIMAAGSGNRFDTDIPKQFYLLQGKMILEYTLDTFYFLLDKWIDKIVVVLPAEYLDTYKSQLQHKYPKLVMLSGGNTRHESVCLGLRQISNAYVLIHDGVRPFVSVDLITAVIKETKINKNAIAALPITDTVKKASNSFITETIPRKDLFLAQTPQGFHLKTLKKAMEVADKFFELLTDESMMLENMGIYPSIVLGSKENIKITTKEDLLYATYLASKKNTNIVNSKEQE